MVVVGGLVLGWLCHTAVVAEAGVGVGACIHQTRPPLALPATVVAVAVVAAAVVQMGLYQFAGIPPAGSLSVVVQTPAGTAAAVGIPSAGAGSLFVEVRIPAGTAAAGIEAVASLASGSPASLAARSNRKSRSCRAFASRAWGPSGAGSTPAWGWLSVECLPRGSIALRDPGTSGPGSRSAVGQSRGR